MPNYISTYAMACATRPESPVYCLRPQVAQVATRWFLDNFPGRTLFAVKTNPHFVDTIAAAGLRHFDVASLWEIEHVHARVPGARLSFMHPVKSRLSIRRAYFEFGVRDFALDSEDELHKVLEETGNAPDLNLFVRLSVCNRRSRLKLAGKFGVAGKPAARLLFKTRQVARRLGVCFHAGSQLMQPQAYADAMQLVSRRIRESGVIIDILDVGGGFPSVYPDSSPPPLKQYVDMIADSFELMPVSETCELWCEPGRALVAEAASLLVRVELRKDNALYINDGTYGGLFDAGQPAFNFPMTVLRATGSGSDALTPFSLYGPTCDSIDFMPGPFMLPADIAEGDYIEIFGLGAYSMQLRTQFNGFGGMEMVEVNDAPLLSMYGLERQSPAVHEHDAYASAQENELIPGDNS